MNPAFITVSGLTVSLGGQKILQDIHLRWEESQQWALVGPAGSGKSVFARTLAGNYHYEGTIRASFAGQDEIHDYISLVDQQHRFRDLNNQTNFYYQQRYNSMDAEQTVTVRAWLGVQDLDGISSVSGYSIADLLRLFQIGHLLEEPLIQLSNGENKRLQIAGALLRPRKLLILDQPFVGLDSEGRNSLIRIMQLLTERGLKILLMASPGEIPDFFTHIAQMSKGRIVEAYSRVEFRDRVAPRQEAEIDWQSIPFPNPELNDFKTAVNLVDVNLSYGDRKILDGIHWRIDRGECWALSGPNGSGKSTLLSLITADNPQAYANEIYLFDRRRGSGESIWEIKSRIGFLSPELHLYFDPGCMVFQAIGSGLFDTIGLFRSLNEDQESLVWRWMGLFSLEEKANRRLNQLSLGEQRLVLLARALIKNPAMMVLDEPGQGLDSGQMRFLKQLLGGYCRRSQTTMIYVSHVAEEVPDCVQYHASLDRGRLMVQ